MQEMDISNNPICEISPKISQLFDLKILKANNCKLEKITHGIANLSNLHILELKNNLLTGFLPKIAFHDIKLDSLTHLDLSNNKLTNIPTALKHLSKLTTLLLSYNKISEITKICREEFSKLFVLDLSNNKISLIPNAFGVKLKNLQNLNLSNNDIVKIPHNIGLMTQLKTIQIEGNPLKSIRRPIVEKGSVAILEYLKQKYNEEMDSQIEPQILDSDEEENSSQFSKFQPKISEKSAPKPILKKPEKMQYEPMQISTPVQKFEEEKMKIVNKKSENSEKIAEINEQISKLNKEIEENYAMSKPKILEKKKQIAKLIAERAKLIPF